MKNLCRHHHSTLKSYQLSVAVVVVLYIISSTATFLSFSFSFTTTTSTFFQPAFAAIKFTKRCGGGNFNSIADAEALCTSNGEFLAAPRKSGEISDIDNLNPTNHILGGLKVSTSYNVWKWTQGPYTGDAFYVDGGGVSATHITPPWDGAATLTGGTTLGILHTASSTWDTTTFPVATNCAVCEDITKCDEVCYKDGTQSDTGTPWTSCTCTCKSDYVGRHCDSETSVHCNAAVLTSVSKAHSTCQALGGFLSTPATADQVSHIWDLRDGNTNILVAGSDSKVEGQWLWTDGVYTGQQFWQGDDTGSTVNGYTSHFNNNEPNDYAHPTDPANGEDFLCVASDGWNDCNLIGNSVKCYACQYTGCSTSSPCTAANTLTATGVRYSDCQCGCQTGYTGRFCECPVISCDAEGGEIVQGPTTTCYCKCKPNYQGAQCNSHTLTPSTTLTASQNTGTHTVPHTSTATHPPTPTATLTMPTTQTASLTPTLSTSVTPSSTDSNTDVQTPTPTTPETTTTSQSTAKETPTATIMLHLQTSTPTYVPEVDYSNDTIRRSCPAIAMVLYRSSGNATTPPTQIQSHTIDDTDIREGRLIVNVSLSGGSGGRFAFRSSTPSTISFTVESTGVQDPRSFPAVVNMADVACAFSPIGSRQFIVCTFPPSPDYTLRVAETLVVRGGGTTGLSPPCTDVPWNMGTIKVEPTKKDVLQQVFQVAAAVATGVATAVVMLLADGTPIEIQVMIVLLNSVCASNVDRESVVLVRYFLSPVIHLGWWWVVVVNVCIAVGFAILHTMLVAVVYAYRIRRARKEVTKTTGKRKNRVSAQTKFDISKGVSSSLLYPGLPLVICHVLYIGVACGTCDVLRTMRGSQVAISVLGIAFLATVPLIDAHLLSHLVTVAYVPYEALGCAPETGCLSWLYPKGVWGKTADVKRFFGLIGPYRDGYRYAALIPLALALLAGLTMHGLPDVVPCDYLFIVEGIVLCLLGALFILIRPTRATAQSLLTALCLICVGLLAVMQIIAIRANSATVEGAKTALNYIVVFMVIVRSAHNIFVYYIEWKWAKEVDAAAIGAHDDEEEDGGASVLPTAANFQDMLDLHATEGIKGAKQKETHLSRLDDITPSSQFSHTTPTDAVLSTTDSSAGANNKSGQYHQQNVNNPFDDMVPICGPADVDTDDDDDSSSTPKKMTQLSPTTATLTTPRQQFTDNGGIVSPSDLPLFGSRGGGGGRGAASQINIATYAVGGGNGASSPPSSIPASPVMGAAINSINSDVFGASPSMPPQQQHQHRTSLISGVVVYSDVMSMSGFGESQQGGGGESSSSQLYTNSALNNSKSTKHRLGLSRIDDGSGRGRAHSLGSISHLGALPATDQYSPNFAFLSPNNRASSSTFHSQIFGQQQSPHHASANTPRLNTAKFKFLDRTVDDFPLEGVGSFASSLHYTRPTTTIGSSFNSPISLASPSNNNNNSNGRKGGPLSCSSSSSFQSPVDVGNIMNPSPPTTSASQPPLRSVVEFPGDIYDDDHHHSPPSSPTSSSLFSSKESVGTPYHGNGKATLRDDKSTDGGINNNTSNDDQQHQQGGGMSSLSPLTLNQTPPPTTGDQPSTPEYHHQHQAPVNLPPFLAVPVVKSLQPRENNNTNNPNN